VERNLQDIAYFLSVFEVGDRGAVFCSIVFIPVFHKKTLDPKALPQQQICGDGRINSP
jgi:hypothetical protein